ncbi:MAG: tetratricopeptide repeat protein [Candidatus Altiarchaeales archaeon]|nr:tetratricopeptide repeat protein [Candidatus Altiarchaeales archaeon]MBD3417256.1 tetratricopeptide repeat protein [Candidatus Altiarchaeales archaeon]
MKVVSGRPVESALPDLRENQTKQGLLSGITDLIGDYSREGIERGRGDAVDVELPDRTVLRTLPDRSFRNERWYQELSPREQMEAEVEIACHIHREVRSGYPRVVSRFNIRHCGEGRVEKAREFKNAFGHLPGNPKVDAVDCIHHSQIFTKIASTVGFEAGVMDIPAHMVAVVKAGNSFLVSDALYGSLLSVDRWVRAVDAESGLITRHLAYKLREGGSIAELMQADPVRMSADAADARAHESLGLLLSQFNQAAEAKREYERALELDPKSYLTHENFANLLFNCGESDKAEEHVRRALELNPKSADAHIIYGNILTERETHEGLEMAGRHYRRAVELNPRNPYAQFNYGSFLGNIDDFDGARKHFSEALKLDPSNSLAREYLRRIDDMERG